MKSVSQIKWSAFVALAAIGAMGAVGACSKDGGPGPDPVEIAAPTALAATMISETQIDLTWTDNATNEDGYRIESCSGAACANFAQIGTVAANVNAFSNTGLTAGTSYSYRVRAHNAEGASNFSNTASATTEIIPPPPPPPVASPIFVGAGEITSCASQAAMATATLIEGMLADTMVTVFTTGNNLDDPDNATATYETCFDRSWGRFKARTYYSVGTGDFDTVGEEAAYAYFGERIGSPDGWYSLDRGNWHIIVLNTTTWQHGVRDAFEPGGRQMTWLTADLAANTQPCIMVISWERRLYTSGTGAMGMQFNMNEIAKALYSAGADILVSGKDHVYERFPQTNVDGQPDPNGFRQFIVGTGGRTLWNTITPAGSTVEAQAGAQQGAHGVIKFTLDSASYKWEFVPTIAGGFTDTGTTDCN
jgi:hypothetical protein